jgi:hypothetical protein
MSDVRQWGWNELNCEDAHGTFDTREEAIADAEGYLDTGHVHVVSIGRVRVLEAKDYVTVDVDRMLYDADEEVYDDYGMDEGRLFDFIDKDEDKVLSATIELAKLIEDWSTKYLHNTADVWVLEDEEEITINLKGAGDGDDSGGDGDGDDDDGDDEEDDEDSEEEDGGDEEEEEDSEEAR